MPTGHVFASFAVLMVSGLSCEHMPSGMIKADDMGMV
jgi:hypothetical protein